MIPLAPVAALLLTLVAGAIVLTCWYIHLKHQKEQMKKKIEEYFGVNQ
jgi:hypothetical protein